MMQINAVVENRSTYIYYEPTGSILVTTPVARIILRWIKLTSSGRMSVSAGISVFVYLVSPWEARRWLWEVPPTEDVTACPAPLPTSQQHELAELWLNFPAQSRTFLMPSILVKPNLYFISHSCHLTQAHHDRF